MNQEITDVQTGFRKGRGTRNQTVNICWIIEKARKFQKKASNFCFIDDAKAFDYVDHHKLWKILKEMGIPIHLTCLLQTYIQVKKHKLKPDVEKRSGSESGKKYIKPVYCHFAYLIHMQSTSWDMPGDEPQAGIKIAGRNINNLRYADVTL